MKQARQDFASLLRHLHTLGVESAGVSCSVCKGRSYTCHRCDGAGYDHVSAGTVLVIMGEMLTVNTDPFGFADVLNAAKAAGVY